jgi:hypothetical protein
LENESLGKAGEAFYSWGFGFVDRMNDNLPNERTLSNHLFYLENEPINRYEISLAEVFFGQFLNHDQEYNLENPQVKYRIFIEEEDDQFLQAHPGLSSINISYSVLSNPNVPFSYVNQQTSYLDLSTVYGFSDEMTNALRSHVDGLLLAKDYEACTYTDVPPPFGSGVCTEEVSTIPNLPTSEFITGIENHLGLNEFGQDRNFLLSCGDLRCNENAALSFMHVAFFREHNRIAKQLKLENDSLDDETLFQEARKLNIAIFQHIVMDEYVETLLGKNFSALMKYEYTGYNSSVNPSTSHLFAGASFRYGHSSLRSYRCLDQNASVVECVPKWTPPFWGLPQGVMPLLGSLGPTAFTVPELYHNMGGIENVVYSLVYQLAGEVDNVIDNTFRNLGKGFVPLDISAADIARGRINGLPDYHSVRAYFYKPIYGEPDCPFNPVKNESDPIECFLHITEVLEDAEKLKFFYSRLDRIDAIIGMYFEDHVYDSPLPPTMAISILREYERKRDGDRFWYENNQFDQDTLKMIKERTIVDIINENFNLNLTNFFHTIKKNVDESISSSNTDSTSSESYSESIESSMTGGESNPTNESSNNETHSSDSDFKTNSSSDSDFKTSSIYLVIFFVLTLSIFN